jgi:hypothetical protein
VSEKQYSKAGFEIQVCGRCGGSGRYSFNQIDGDRCFGCGGSGKVFSKRGAAARAYYLKSMERPISELKPGDYVLDSVGIGPRKVWQKVDKVEEANEGKSLSINLMRGGKPSCQFQAWKSFELVSIVSEESRLEKLAAAIAYQECLNDKGKPLLRKLKAAGIPVPA